MKSMRVALGILFLAPMWVGTASGETRGNPFPEEYFTEHCSQIFVGVVLEVNDHAMPTKARVLLSIKGKVSLGERKLAVKDPGRSVIFREEFDPARTGAVGVFFVGTDWDTGLLMKYKEIPGVSPEPETKKEPKK